jgi:parvulin-like peptidyl-prolyl isomerase
MRTLVHNLVLLTALVAAAACNSNPSPLDHMAPPPNASHAGSNAGKGSGAPTTPAIDIDSKDILARTDTAKSVDVKHVLIGWKDLAAAYRGQMDPRAAARSNDDAAALAQDIAKQLTANPDAIDALVQKYSEDPGSKGGEPYTVDASSGFVPEFKKLALRLQTKEIGIVRTNYGYHVMERVLPPPPDPLESADILARPASTEGEPIKIQHVLIGWKDSPAAKQGGRVDPRAAARTKEEADKLAKDTLDKARAGDDMKKLMKDISEDPGSKDDGKAYDVDKDGTGPTAHFEQMAMRLKMGEVGLARTSFGWHVMKRVPPPPPPPPDALDSVDILKRPVATDKAKVKHILLGWKEVHGKSDPRGEGRDRATLEKLVKDTVAKLQKGDKIEPIMAELSEDPGSAKDGKSYDVSPTAQLVAPFKNLSLRLKVGEVGVVKSDFGIHIIQRVE